MSRLLDFVFVGAGTGSRLARCALIVVPAAVTFYALGHPA